MNGKFLVIVLVIVVCFFMFAANALAGWSNVYVEQVVPRSDGDVILWLTPGPNETQFTGNVRLYIDTSAPGGKNMLATVLTAMMLEKDIMALSANVPRLNPIYQCTSVGLSAP